MHFDLLILSSLYAKEYIFYIIIRFRIHVIHGKIFAVGEDCVYLKLVSY